MGSHIRLVSDLIAYAASKQGFAPAAAEVHELYESILPYMQGALKFISESSDADFEEKFKVQFGSSGFNHYYFALIDTIIGDLPDFEPEGYHDYKRLTAGETTELADKQVRWIQSVVPDYLMNKLQLKFGPTYFDEIVPKEIQKACQAKRIDDDLDEKLPVETYLDWIQIQKIAILKEIRDDVKAVLSIKLSNDGSGKHFYTSWFDAVNRIRRIAAHPAGRTYKDEDLETLSAVVEHLREHLPHMYLEGKYDAPIS